jgi:hypothetical protein
VTERSTSNVLPRYPHIASFEHQSAESHSLSAMPSEINNTLSQMLTHLCSRPIQPLAGLNTLKTMFHVSVQSRMNFLPVEVLSHSSHNLGKRHTKPSGTTTLARPTFRRTSLSSPVCGFLIAALLPGQTMPLHCSCSIEAEGIYESALDN